jgi:hypothetical protein
MYPRDRDRSSREKVSDSPFKLRINLFLIENMMLHIASLGLNPVPR